MELDNLKNAWNNTATPQLPEQHFRNMLSEKTHPVLQPIRRQLIFETLGFGVFLAVYYTMFDGDTKPIWLNLVLTGSILMPLIHSLIGYRFFRFIPTVGAIHASLLQYLQTAKTYAVFALVCRFFFVGGLLIFFSFGVQFNFQKQLAIGAAVVIVAIQLLMLARIWLVRISTLKKLVEEFK